METEIVFCERCGVSIPEQDLVQARQASGGRDLCASCVGPAKAADGDLRLYFCENCRISIAVSDVLTGAAKVEGPGYLCAVCSRSTPAERVARRTAVEGEMAAAAAAAGVAPGARPAPDPIYFCDSCNASIPASFVATGRALVASGRTWCERCRPRVESDRPHARPGVGAAPVVAAALLAAAVTAAGLVAWERWKAEDAGKERANSAADDLAGIRRELRFARDSGETALVLADRADRAVKDLERKADSVRGELQLVRAAADRASAQAAGGDRVARLEKDVGNLQEAVALLRDDLATVAAERREAARPPEKTDPEPEPPTAMDPGAGPPASPEPGSLPPAPGAAAAAPSPAVLRCIALLKDRDAGVRFSAAIELGKLGDRSAWSALVETLRKDDDPFVRRACARSIGELKAYAAFPDLVEALLDGEEYVAIQSSRVIKEMAGQDFGFKQGQAKSDRKRVADRAKKWWEENKDRLAQ